MSRESGLGESDHAAVVEGSLAWSFATVADVPELSELRAAVAYFDNPIFHNDATGFAADFRGYSQRPGWIATVGRVTGGGIVAYGGVHPDGSGRMWVQLAVHPAARHKQLGRKLVRWAARRAIEWHEQQQPDSELWLGYLADERQAGLGRMLIEEGFRAERWFFDAHRDLIEEPPTPEIDSAIRLVPYTDQRSAEVRIVLNQVWERVPGSHPVTAEQWEEQMYLVSPFEGLSWIALAEGTDQVIGYALNTVLQGDDGFPDEGWTLRLGVAPSSRHNGVGAALLQASMHAFWEAGLSQAGLGVDTGDPELALEFFRRCGYTPDDALVQFQYHDGLSTQ